jgi:nitrate/nitrite-specific signal transduction histidine kinase
MVRDNGRGIDEENLATRRNGHWGLEGMHERAGRIGARLRVLSGAAVGTEIELCVLGGLAYVPDSLGAF